VYDVPDQTIGWVAQCDEPRAPLDRASIIEGIGREDVRIVTFDCTQGWLFPDLNDQGIYVLHRDLMQDAGQAPFAPQIPVDPFVANQVSWMRLSFDQPLGNDGQPFVLYETPRGDWRNELKQRAQASGSTLTLLRLPGRGGEAIVLDGPLEFLNGVVRSADGHLEVSTIWKVVEGPVTRPFSIMGHLVAADGTTIAGSDGLGISPLALAPGDLYVHRHRFSELPTGEVHFQTGAYWLDTMEEWVVKGSLQAATLAFDLL
jgi:hypothetical protein